MPCPAAYRIVLLAAALLLATHCIAGPGSSAHHVTFCGEDIPVHKDFVAQKLMDVISRQIPTANMRSLKQKAHDFFPYIEQCLKKYGIPEDFKYLPIVESGFANLTSRVGAEGFWQLMPTTAAEHNLKVNGIIDERDDPAKATRAACEVILQFYNVIKVRTGVASWVLTAASYNFGPGNVLKAVHRQGTDYFAMDLNPETAEYVYKIIAIKELFENPELYMNGFGRNVFQAPAEDAKPAPPPAGDHQVNAEFATLSVKINKPGDKPARPTEVAYVAAHLTGNYSKWHDGNLVSLELDGDLVLPSSFTRKGSTIKGRGWIVGDRVYVNLGYGHRVQLLDANSIKGIDLRALLDGNQYLLLKTEVDAG